jgi:omega-6 fatty acid desaturase (delta-12 desaturase)
MTMHTAPPLPSAIAHLRARNRAGWAFLALAGALSVGGGALAWSGGPAAWAIGEALLAAALVEWFVLLHECGHGTLFASRRLNVLAGHLAGFFALIPFPVWTRVHGRHHKWTGWQDVDPTTVALAPKPRAAIERHLVNFCWRYWVPLFSVMYRVNNFWHLRRIVRLFPQPDLHRPLVRSTIALAAVYGLVAWTIGPFTLLWLAGPALVAALIVEDVLLISQHTHLPMQLAHGGEVVPVRAIDQETFTRSMRLPALASSAALHFDAHELHHMYPFVPGYRLAEIPYTPVNEVNWRRWVLAARAVPGEVLLFQHRGESGFDL